MGVSRMIWPILATLTCHPLLIFLWPLSNLLKFSCVSNQLREPELRFWRGLYFPTPARTSAQILWMSQWCCSSFDKDVRSKELEDDPSSQLNVVYKKERRRRKPPLGKAPQQGRSQNDEAWQAHRGSVGYSSAWSLMNRSPLALNLYYYYLLNNFSNSLNKIVYIKVFKIIQAELKRFIIKSLIVLKLKFKS